MKKNIKLLMALLFPITLLGCETEINEGENIIEVEGYKIKINSNSSGLIISETEENETNISDIVHDEVSKKYCPRKLFPIAHDEFKSKEDIEDLSKYYFMIADNPNVSTGNPETLRYLDEYLESDEAKANSFSFSNYVFKIEFDLIIKEDEQYDSYSLKLNDLSFPQYNIFSAIVVGKNGYQELNSIKQGLTDDYLYLDLNKEEKQKLSIYIYIDGNDENVTTTNMAYINTHNGEIDFQLELIPNIE